MGEESPHTLPGGHLLKKTFGLGVLYYLFRSGLGGGAVDNSLDVDTGRQLQPENYLPRQWLSYVLRCGG